MQDIPAFLLVRREKRTMEDKYLLSEEKLTEIAVGLNITLKQVTATLDLLADGCTVPFIARYRKEATGALNDEQIKAISDNYEYVKSLEKRKADVIRLIDEKGLLTPELNEQILAATKLVEIEDLYRPFKEKKKTKATEAIKLGLEPLADLMMKNPKLVKPRVKQEKPKTVENNAFAKALAGLNLEVKNEELTVDAASKEEYLNNVCKPFLNENVPSVEFAILNASYIIAERISDNADYRKVLRFNIFKKGTINSKLKKNAVDEGKVFENYYDYSELVSHIKPHRMLALNRAEAMDILSVSIEFDKTEALEYLNRKVIGRTIGGVFDQELRDCAADAYKRLIFPSLEREIRAELKEKAEAQAINIFGLNLKNLLLQAPLKGKIVLGVDPAFRTGCKLAVIDQTGKFLEKDKIYPNEIAKGVSVDPQSVIKSEKTVLRLISKYKVEIIAIGNGTASRETESFIANVIRNNNLKISYVIVSEAGASVYSASEVAREEFPDFNVEERSAVSIARRIQDPLAELVKIEPKAIGVGQYQHDVTQSKLEETLDFVVSEAVNKVGVNVNTASKNLLMYVSGLNKGIAANIVKYRDENGMFKSRKEILKVPKLGPKAYEQAIGFLRITGFEPLDQTSIHPESYDKAYLVMKELEINPLELGSADVINKVKTANKIALKEKLNIDTYLLDDILDALSNPLRDIRDNFDTPQLRSDVLRLEDLTVGMELEGTVRNVVDFGCFIDCGLHGDGLLHISKMTKGYIKHPSDMFSVGQLVKVYVYKVDLVKQKLQLTMFKNEE